MASPANNLATSRINRLLRPLRNKCASLASLPSSSAYAVPSTYSSKDATWSINDPPPLVMLQPPGGAGVRIHLDEHYMKSLELSRRLYAVRDCFRNLVLTTFGTSARSSRRTGANGVASLAAMCSMVIGEAIQAECTTNTAAKELDDEERMDDEEIMEMTNEIYEAVPVHYRRWTAVSHGLSMVLCTCPPHPTLLTLLMDVCLSWNLVQESHILLRALLVASISPPGTPNYPSPITHPSHSSYLVDLCAIWSAGQASVINNERQVYTPRVFVNILVDVLTESHLSDAWTCKSLAKFVRSIRKHDFASFVHVAAGLVDTISHNAGGAYAMGGKGKSRESAGVDKMRDRLNKWLACMHDGEWRNLEYCSEVPADMYTVTEFLRQARWSELHILRTKMGCTISEIPDSIICLTTYCLAMIAPQSSNKADYRDLIELLSETKPITSTFDDLVRSVLNDEDDFLSLPQGWHEDVMRKLHLYSAPLRSNLLLKLEASLWACALRYVECNYFLGLSYREEADVLKKQLIEAVDEAEMRCFGSKALGQTPAVQAYNRDLGQSPGGEWEWEEMVGGWIRRSPIAHKPRLGSETSLPHSKRVLRSRLLLLMRRPPISASPTPSSSSSAIFSRSSTHDTSESFSDNCDANEEERDVNPAKKPRLSPRISNFTSILADAQMNRTILHEEPQFQHTPKNFAIRRPSTYIHRKGVSSDENLVPSRDDSFAMLPSDDSLDLFQAQSSPCMKR